MSTQANDGANGAGRQRWDFTRQRLFPGFDGKFCKVQPSLWLGKIRQG